jgi:hypothetical protein
MGRYIAMWSGPRNISTAMLRSWGSRADTFVCDEPLYAHYLRETGIDHPGRDEVLASQENDWQKVVGWLTGEIPRGRTIFYQKHMAHHLLPDIGREWLSRVTNALLIRDPGEMLSSLLRVTPAAGVLDTGLPQQCEIFEFLQSDGQTAPPVIDARDVLENPRGMLEALCAALEVPFDPAMIAWEIGPRDTDGVWAKYWYAAVKASTGFGHYQKKKFEIPEKKRAVLDECQSYYDRLYERRLTAGV